jgi:flagellar protein FlaI
LADKKENRQAPVEETPQNPSLPPAPDNPPAAKDAHPTVEQTTATPSAAEEAHPPAERAVTGDAALEALETDESLSELEEKLAERAEAQASEEFLEYCSFVVPPGSEEVERYWITKPYVWVSVVFNPDQNERTYHLVEPNLTPGEKTALEMLHRSLMNRMSYDESIRDRDRVLREKVSEILSEHGIELGPKSMNKIFYYLKRNYIGYGKIDALLRDPNTEDISCDGLNVPIFLYHRKYQSLRTNLLFRDQNRLDLFVIRLAERSGKQITLGKPTLDASLPEGYRLQATLGTEITTRGSSFSIRKYAEEPFTPVHLINFNTFSSDMLAYLWLATENKKNIVIVGGTASGKTCTLNALSMFIWPDAKIVSIEDTREMALYQENWVPNVTRDAPGERSIDMYDLLRQALRQRPEAIIVGEVRGKEALTLFQAMTTGHTVYSTMHAGSIQEMVHRLEGEPINVPHHMLASLDIVCLQLMSYYQDQRVRRNQTTVEISGIDAASGALRTNRIYERNPLTDKFEKVGESEILRDIAEERGWSAIRLQKELLNRQKILEYLARNNITRMSEVATIIRQYYFDPEKVIRQIGGEKKPE